MKLKNIALTIALVLGLSTGTALANVPWGAVQNVTGSTPSPTSFTSAPVLIDLMTGNTTVGAFSGGSAGVFFTVILEQDGTGSRTVAWPTNATGGWPTTFPAAVTAANGYTVLVGQVGTVTTAYNFIGEYDNLSLASVYTNTEATSGAAVAPNAITSETAVSVPGVTVATGCACLPQTYPATWQVGIFEECVPTTNQIVCTTVNPTAATRTPAAVTLNIRLTTP